MMTNDVTTTISWRNDRASSPPSLSLALRSLAAVNAGIGLHGICLFPAVDMPDRHTGKWLHNGIYDLVEDGDNLKRVPCEPYIAELRRWQQELKRITALDTDPYSNPVELQDVIDAAKRLHKVPDRDWH